MALVESLKLPLGNKMPAFDLPDPYGEHFSGRQLMGRKGLLVVFTCNHCPYAQAIWPRLIKLAKYAKEMDVNTVAINPNIHPGYPEDAPEKMRDNIEAWDLQFPYLVDETQGIAKKFQAQCTPDLYLFDVNHELVYHGRLDDNWKEESKVKKQELKEAIDCLVDGKPIPANQVPSMGCSIKWR